MPTDRPSIDLDAYLQRIGVAAPVKPDLPTLRAILRAHIGSIPFENLDPFLGVPVSLEFDAVQRKLVHDGRGGYCFEQNLLLGNALRAIGFAVTGLAARVLWGQPDDAITARSHMLLRVDVDGAVWLADAGFGGSTPTGPLQLVADNEQATPHETFRLQRRDDDDWRVQMRAGNDWKTLYRFDLQPQYPIDYRASNYWTSTNPDSHFVTTLIAARATPGRRLVLRNREFAVHVTDGVTERRMLHNTAEIRGALQDEFLIRLPRHLPLDQKFENLPG
ncbi:MAG: arylamine N-acetyltransferase family protein [Rhodanobacteraceae bacterium]